MALDLDEIILWYVVLFSPSLFCETQPQRAPAMQIITFVDATSGANTTVGAKSNRYYVNAFTSSIVGTTGSFLTNTNRRVSRSVQSSIEYAAGGTDIAAGIEDLTAQVQQLPAPIAGLAIVITDGRSTRAAAEGVTVAAVAIGGGADRPTLEAVASTGSDGEELVFETDRFDDIAGLLAAVFTRIGAPSSTVYTAYAARSSVTSTAMVARSHCSAWRALPSRAHSCVGELPRVDYNLPAVVSNCISCNLPQLLLFRREACCSLTTT